MFEEKYSRLKFWLILIFLLVPLIALRVIETIAEAKENVNLMFVVAMGYFIIAIVQLNTLANRIRDYGSNPWNALWSLIPFVNIIMALYYGSIKGKSRKEKVNVEDTSLTKAVINHTQDIASSVKPKITEYIEKHSPTQYNDTTFTEKLSEDEIYEKVMLEIEENNKIKSTWARAFSQSNGDENKAQALYINLRVEELKILEEKRIKTYLQQEKEYQAKLAKEKLEQEKKESELIALKEFKKENKIVTVKQIEKNLYLATFGNSPIDAYITWNGNNWEFKE